MPTVWWMGRGSSNTIRPEDWAAHDIVAGSVVWDASNGWSVDEATLTSDQIAVLAASHDYLTGQTGPRQFPMPGGVPIGRDSDYLQSAYAYYIAILAMYEIIKDFDPGDSHIFIDTDGAPYFEAALTGGQTVLADTDGAPYVPSIGA